MLYVYGLREGRFAVADYHRRCDDLRSSAPFSLLRIFDIKIKAPDAFPALGALFYRVKSGLFIFPIREIFFSNWANDFARFLNHDAKIRNPVLSVVR